MKLKDISPKSLKKVPDTELSALHLRCHQLYGKTKEFTKDDIVKIHVWILNEMRYRGVGYLIQDNELDRRSKPLLRKEEKEEVQKGPLEGTDLSKLKVPTIIFIPKFLRVSGSQVYARDRSPNDIDIIVCGEEEQEKDRIVVVLDKSLRLKVDRFIKERFGVKGETCWHGTPYGANWKNLPIFDLALVPRNPLEFEEMNEPEFAEEFYKSEESAETEVTEKAMGAEAKKMADASKKEDKIEVEVEKAMGAEAKKMADASKKEDKIEVFRFFYPLKTSLSPFEYRVGEVYGIDEMVKKLKQLAQRRKLDTEIPPIFLNKKYD